MAADHVELKVLYGSSTGNSRRLAHRAAKAARAGGIATAVADLAAYPAASLRQEKRVVIVVATWGDGEPPDTARDFCRELFAGRLGKLDHLEYAVLALGDSCFRQFCGCGIRVDECLALHGAKRFLDCRKLDTTFHEDFSRWQVEFLERLRPDCDRRSLNQPHL